MIAPSISRSCAVSRKILAICLLSIAPNYKPRLCGGALQRVRKTVSKAALEGNPRLGVNLDRTPPLTCSGAARHAPTLAKPPLLLARLAQESSLHCRRDSFARSWHRCERCHLYPHQCIAPPRSPCPSPGTPRRTLGCPPGQQNHVFLSHVPRTRTRPARFSRSNRLER